MEKAQIEHLNKLLFEIYKLRREENERNKTTDTNDVDMTVDMYHNKYFHFEIYLLEMIPKPIGAIVYRNKMFSNLSPQEIYFGFLKGDNNIYIQYKDIISYQNKNINLLKMVTPNLDKNLWYLESDLVRNRLLKVLCKMNLKNMKNMLKNCPLPDICFCPSEYKINDPESFVKVINKTQEQDKKVFNFIPFIRNYSIVNNTINDKSVYYLYDKIKLVNDNCLTLL